MQRSVLRMLHCGDSRQSEFTHRLTCYFRFLFGESQTSRKSEADCECCIARSVKEVLQAY